jgi:hypothetical protein
MFEHRRAVVSHPYIPDHPPMMGHVGPKPQQPRLQVVVERNGLVRCATDVPFKGMIQEILGGPSHERTSARDSRESHPALGHTYPLADS